MSTSTSTGYASIPSTAAERIRASMAVARSKRRSGNLLGLRRRSGTGVPQKWTETCSRNQNGTGSRCQVAAEFPRAYPLRVFRSGVTHESVVLRGVPVGIECVCGPAGCRCPAGATGPLLGCPYPGTISGVVDKTVACSGHQGQMSDVSFYAVDAPSGAIELAGEMAHAWWVREGNRIYLPANALGQEWLVRHEMLHALMQRGSHPADVFVTACHVASAAVWRDSSLTVDPGNPRSH